MKAQYDEKYEDLNLNTITFYFTIPREELIKLTHKEHLKAVRGTISIELPMEYGASWDNADCQISPVQEQKGCYIETDWQKITLTKEQIKELMSLITEE